MISSLHKCFHHASQAALCAISLTALAGLTLLPVQSAQADTLTLNGGYHPFYVTTSPSFGNESHVLEAGGDAVGTLNGITLAGTYCIDLLDPVFLGATYPTTQTNGTGTIFGNSVNNAGAISWLMTTYGAEENTIDTQNALQAAIWRTENGSNFELDGADNGNSGNSQVMIDTYKTMLASVGNNTGALGSVVWISPNDTIARNYNYQGLVGVTTQFAGTTQAIPEQGSLVLLIPAALTLAGTCLLRKRRSSLA